MQHSGVSLHPAWPGGHPGALLAVLAVLACCCLPLALFVAQRRRVGREEDEEEDADLSRAMEDLQTLDQDRYGQPFMYDPQREKLDTASGLDHRVGGVASALPKHPIQGEGGGGGGGGGLIPSSGRGRQSMDDTDGAGAQGAFNVSGAAGAPSGASGNRVSLLLETVTQNVMSVVGRKSYWVTGDLLGGETVWKPNPTHTVDLSYLATPVETASQRATTTTQWSTMPSKKEMRQSVFKSARNSIFQTLFGSSETVAPAMSPLAFTGFSSPSSGAQALQGKRAKGSVVNPLFAKQHGVQMEEEEESAQPERFSENRLLRMETFRALSGSSAEELDTIEEDNDSTLPTPPVNRYQRINTLNPLFLSLRDPQDPGPADEPDDYPVPEDSKPDDRSEKLPIELERAVRAVHGAPALLLEGGTLHMASSMGLVQGLLGTDFDAAAEAACANPVLLATAPGKVHHVTSILRDVLWGIPAALGTLAETPVLLEANEAALRVTLPGMSEKLGGFSKGAAAVRQAPEVLQAPMGLTDEMFLALASTLGSEKAACEVLSARASLWAASKTGVAEAMQALAAACGGMGTATEVALEAPTALTWRQKDITEVVMALEAGFGDNRGATLAVLPALLCNPHLLEIADTDLMAEAAATLVEVFETPERAARAARRCPALLLRRNSHAMGRVKKALQRQALSRKQGTEEGDTGAAEALRVLERYPELMLAKRHVIEEALPCLEHRLAGEACSVLNTLAAHRPLLRARPRSLERAADALEKALGGWAVVAEVVDCHPAALALTPRVIKRAIHTLDEALGGRARAVEAVRQNPKLLAGGEKDFSKTLGMLMLALGGEEPALEAVKEHPELLAASADQLQEASMALECTAGSKVLGMAMARKRPPLLLATPESLSTNLPEVVELFRKGPCPAPQPKPSLPDSLEAFLGDVVEGETDINDGGFAEAYGEEVMDDGEDSEMSVLFATLMLGELDKSLQALEAALSTAPRLVQQWVQEDHLPRIREALLHLTDTMEGRSTMGKAEIIDLGDGVMNAIEDANGIILDSRADGCASIEQRWKMKGPGRDLPEEQEGMSLIEIIRRCKEGMKHVERGSMQQDAGTSPSSEQISTAGQAGAVLAEVREAMEGLQGVLSTVDAAFQEEIIHCMTGMQHCIQQIVSVAQADGKLSVAELALRRNAVMKVIGDACKAAHGDRAEGIQRLGMSVAEARHLAPQDGETSLLDMIHTIRTKMNHVSSRESTDCADRKKKKRVSVLAEASDELRAMLKRRRGSTFGT
ncbi:hypothetical protein CYMTET_30823 [Cymbomonas tetramitiformis]|uniref:Uncharacterized protein n=1 Tax=Cymbomonas tetramitiformis TaxID=36881 RepID=A0AAE0FIP5_9CHLO|nr:hypothetical protein CYMTET_30823 [Cymbomonas tetramitiformis]